MLDGGGIISLSGESTLWESVLLVTFFEDGPLDMLSLLTFTPPWSLDNLPISHQQERYKQQRPFKETTEKRQ
jgi:hypothetical protein